MRHYIDAITRYALIGVAIIATIAGLCVIPGLTVIVLMFAWFWWAKPEYDWDAEYEALVSEAMR